MLRFIVISAVLGTSALLVSGYSLLVSLAVIYCGGMLAIVVFAQKAQNRKPAKVADRVAKAAHKKLLIESQKASANQEAA